MALKENHNSITVCCVEFHTQRVTMMLIVLIRIGKVIVGSFSKRNHDQWLKFGWAITGLAYFFSCLLKSSRQIFQLKMNIISQNKKNTQQLLYTFWWMQRNKLCSSHSTHVVTHIARGHLSVIRFAFYKNSISTQPICLYN